MESLAVTPRTPLSPHHRRHHHHRLISSRSFSAVRFQSKPLLSRSPYLSLNCSAVSSPYFVKSSEEFVEAANKGNLIPLHRCIFSDHLTPVLAYRCLVKEDDREAPSFLFEAVQPGFKTTHVVFWVYSGL